MNLNTAASRSGTRVTATLMAGVLVSNALIFPAITLYLGNADRFAIPLFAALKLVLMVAVCLFLLAFVVLGQLTLHRQKSATLLFAALSLLCWVQSSFLVWDYGALDGRTINWRDYQLVSMVDIVVWFGLSILLLSLAQKRQVIVVQAAATIFILQLIATTYSLIDASPKLFADTESRNSADLQDILGFSPGRNILHIVTDGFQADVFEDLIAIPEHRDEYNRRYEGFVFYREALGIFPYTRFSVPAFLSGRVYSNHEVKNTFIDEVLRGETIISTARNNDFEVDLIIDGNYWYDRYATLTHNNLYKISDTPGLSSPLADAAMLFDLSLFRITPGALKIFIYRDQKWLASQIFSPGEEFQFKFFTHTYFLDMFTDGMHLNRDKPVYKYMHVMNTHMPMVVNLDCGFAGQPLLASRSRLTIQSKCTLDTLGRLFDKMRSLGIYDETTIIVHGDHGGWVGNHRQGPEIELPNGKPAPPWVKSLASPLVAIKIPYATGPIRISGVLASLLDLPDTLRDIMNWSGDFGHASLLALREGDSRTRYFRYYDWQENEWESDHAPVILEFAIDGSHYEVEWVKHRYLYPPNPE